MTLAHEMAHIARGDLLWGLVPALARRIFFFHPAAWIAEREYALAREAACDEAALRPGADPFVYGQLLLRFASRPPTSASIPMFSHSMLRRRLEMIEAIVRHVPLSRAGSALIALVALTMVPVRLVARDEVTHCLDVGKDIESAYVITNGASHAMCGDLSDVRQADKARGTGGNVIWFHIGDSRWVIHDPKAVAEGSGYLFAITEIGDAQSEVGTEQELDGMGDPQREIGQRALSDFFERSIEDGRAQRLD